jgi:hypothetical protein
MNLTCVGIDKNENALPIIQERGQLDNEYMKISPVEKFTLQQNLIQYFT